MEHHYHHLQINHQMLLLLIFALMIFFKRLKWKTIVTLGALTLVAGTLMYNFGLREYQRKRILTFIDPYVDAKGSGYNAIQSEIAIGSGRIIGKGLVGFILWMIAAQLLVGDLQIVAPWSETHI